MQDLPGAGSGDDLPPVASPEVLAALRRLGDTSNNVARALWGARIKGSRDDPNDCPVARLCRLAGHPTNFDTSNPMVYFALRQGAPAVFDFKMWFHIGRYPALQDGLEGEDLYRAVSEAARRYCYPEP